VKKTVPHWVERKLGQKGLLSTILLLGASLGIEYANTKPIGEEFGKGKGQKSGIQGRKKRF